MDDLAAAPPPAIVRADLGAACTSRAELLRRLEALGVRVLPSSEGAEGVRVDVTMVPSTEQARGEARVTGEVRVTDARGVVLTRTFGDRCEPVTEALVLATAHALEQSAERPREPEPPLPVSARPEVPLASPSPPRDAAEAPAPARRDGGLVALASASGFPRWSAKGVHAFGTRAFGRTRLGLAGAWGREEVDTWDAQRQTGSFEGWGARAGAVAGWGAPWTDVPAGFLVEAGIAWGRARGQTLPAPGPGAGSGQVCTNDGCFDFLPPPNAAARTYATPYVAWSLVLAAPVATWPVRPVAMLGAIAMPTRDGAAFGATAEAGLVWRGL